MKYYTHGFEMSKSSRFPRFSGWTSAPRKRSFGFDEDGIQPINSTTPTKASSKTGKVDTTRSHSGHKGWSSRMDGFAGVSLAQEKSKLKKRRTLSRPDLPTVPALEVADDSSQADIDWDSSEDDGELSDVERLSPLRAAPPPGVKGQQFSDLTPDGSIDVQSSSEDGDAQTVNREDFKELVEEVGTISDYGSDEEQISMHAEAYGKQSERHFGSASPTISSVPTPSQSQDTQNNADDESVKCSQWMRNLQSNMKTPEKDRSKYSCKTPDDSAKKRKQKFISSGLAERLKRLIARQKSDIAFWNHKTQSQDSQDSIVVADSSASLIVRIEQMSMQGRLCLTRCCTAESDASGSGQHIYIIFIKSTCQQFDLQEGTVLEIHPPWKEFLTSSNQRVLLCTYFMRVLSQDAAPTHSHSTTQHGASTGSQSPTQAHHDNRSTVALWKCPCVLDERIPHEKCDAYNNNDHSTEIQRIGYQKRLPEVDTDTNISSQHRLINVTKEQCNESILESIERKGGFLAESVGFLAQVVRVFCRKQSDSNLHPSSLLLSRRTQINCNVGSGSNVRWFALLRDQAGTFCELTLLPSAVDTPEWYELLKDKEGRCYHFTDLKVQGRSTRAKNPALFSCIDSIGDENDKKAPASGFCYELIMSHESRCLPQTGEDASWRILQQRVTLREAHSTHMTRVSTFCKLLYVHKQSLSNRLVWYISDLSLDSQHGEEGHGYARLTVRETCHIDDSILNIIAEDQTVPVILFMQDVMISKEAGLQVDAYSRVYIASVSDGTEILHKYSMDRQLHTDMEVFKPQLAVLEKTSKLGSLVSVSGCICDVDEGTAYSWPVCNHCYAEKLVQIDGTPVFHCQNCDRDVHDPDTKVNLEVFLDSLGPASPVKVQLLQETIDNLLPKESSDEGYELDTVLGKLVGPIDCFITDKTKSENGYLYILKEIKFH